MGGGVEEIAKIAEIAKKCQLKIVPAFEG